ncbi:hypothetical protein [Arthrobacter oryzae]|uniref:hypothetical protein n=1 Tax=Arthrobacter oryzae TaxID=409290 RepID=UPI0011C4062F|nr:hypothetical protein [Arthrobacter oryzae]
MTSESIPLPDGVRLRAEPLPGAQPPRWKGTSVRRRLVALVVFSGVLFTGVAVTAVVAFSWAMIPVWGSHVKVPATVTSQYGYYKRDIYSVDGHHCIVGLQYALDGRPITASSDTHTTCKGSPSSGSTVTISVYQENTVDPIIDGYYTFQSSLPGMVGLLGLGWVFGSGYLLVLVGVSYWGARRIGEGESSWRQVTATVKQLEKFRSSTTVTLEAEDVTGALRIFRIRYSFRSPWLESSPQGTVSLTMLGNGGDRLLFAPPGSRNVKVGYVSVPSQFELRALGL